MLSPFEHASFVIIVLSQSSKYNASLQPLLQDTPKRSMSKSIGRAWPMRMGDLHVRVVQIDSCSFVWFLAL